MRQTTAHVSPWRCKTVGAVSSLFLAGRRIDNPWGTLAAMVALEPVAVVHEVHRVCV
jgi:hypothetical protein